MDFKKLKPIVDAYKQIQEKTKMDPVDSKELKGKFADRKDKDIDNDGDVDSSDEYLHNRRKTIKKAIQKNDDKSETETQVSEESMTDAQKKKREEIVLAMKDKMPEFKKKYGDRAKEVMYATATKMAMKEEADHRSQRYRSATKPEMMVDKMTASDKSFAEPHGSLDGNDSGIDGMKAAQDTAASIKSSGEKAPRRPNDKNVGDKNAETPMDVTRKAGVKEAKTFSELLKALGGLND